MVKKTQKRAAKKPAAKSVTPDFEPNKMGLAVATLASVSLVLLAMIAMFS